MLGPLLASVLLTSAAAHATVPDTMGLGARWNARGGGSVALVDDGTSAFVNPAGLQRPEGGVVGLGVLGATPRVAPVPDLWWDTNRDGVVDEADPPLPYDATPDPVFGLDLHLARRVSRWFAVGGSAYLPTANLIRFATFEPDLPYYVRWGNRMQRANLSAGVAAEPVAGLRLGVAVDLLARTRATARLTIDATAAQGDTTDAVAGEVVYDVHLIEITVVPAVAPVLGLQLEPGEWVDALEALHVGARYHGAVGLPLDVVLDGQANVRLQDVGEEDYVAALVATGDFALLDHDVPQRLDLGLGYQRGPLSLHADGRLTDWRGLVLNIARVESAHLTAPLVDLDGAVRDGNEVSYEVRATWGLRGGVELSLPELPMAGSWGPAQVVLRAGGAIDPPALVSQGDGSAFLDPTHTMFGGGAGLQLGHPLADGGAMGLDLAVQVHTLQAGILPRSSAEPRRGFPVAADGVPYGGRFPTLSAQWRMTY